MILEEPKKVQVKVHIDSYRGRIVSILDFDGTSKEVTGRLTSGIIGKHAVYFEFVSEDKEESFTFDRFSFNS